MPSCVWSWRCYGAIGSNRLLTQYETVCTKHSARDHGATDSEPRKRDMHDSYFLDRVVPLVCPARFESENGAQERDSIIRGREMG